MGVQEPVASSPGLLGRWERLARWQKVASSIVVIAGFVVAYLRFFAPFRETDLTLWTRQQIPISLPTAATDSLPLRLTLGTENIERAILVDLEFSNSGKRVIGSDAEQWPVTLREINGARIQLIGQPTLSPRNLRFAPQRAPDSASFGFTLGLFNPGDRVSAKFLVINPRAKSARLDAELRVAGLQRPTVTDRPLTNRLENAFILPLAAPILVVFFVIFVRGTLPRPGSRSFKTVADSIVQSVFMATMGAAIFAAGLAWIAARVAVALAART